MLKGFSMQNFIQAVSEMFHPLPFGGLLLQVLISCLCLCLSVVLELPPFLRRSLGGTQPLAILSQQLLPLTYFPSQLCPGSTHWQRSNLESPLMWDLWSSRLSISEVMMSRAIA